VIISIEHGMMIFQMILGFSMPDTPEVVINGLRDRKQHFETYMEKKKTGYENTFVRSNEDSARDAVDFNELDEAKKLDPFDLLFKKKMRDIHLKVD
jgi:hypothetical protein